MSCRGRQCRWAEKKSKQYSATGKSKLSPRGTSGGINPTSDSLYLGDAVLKVPKINHQYAIATVGSGTPWRLWCGPATPQQNAAPAASTLFSVGQRTLLPLRRIALWPSVRSLYHWLDYEWRTQGNMTSWGCVVTLLRPFRIGLFNVHPTPPGIRIRLVFMFHNWS